MKPCFHLSSCLTIFLLFTTTVIFTQVACTNTSTHRNDDLELQTYIIRMQQPNNLNVTLENLKSQYESLLASFSSPITSSFESRLIHSYSSVFTGFTARLSNEELLNLEKTDGFLKAYPDQVLPLTTTHSPEFLGLHLGGGFWRSSAMGEGVVIGVVDTGIAPGHPSFDDTGMPSPPSKWKGRCDFGKSVCNNKIIGARNLASLQESNDIDIVSPVDYAGHGTHTASTAAGNFVSGANMFGDANGTASGIAPRAHLAVYKACSGSGCPVSAVLAAMDTAITDGVDILSLSLGGISASFSDDLLAIGSFGAVRKGVVVSCAAGNAGPDPFSVTNAAPWILTVGASAMDRRFKAVVRLGDGREFEGESLFQTTNIPFTPVVHPSNCDSNSITDVKGKIVICDDSADNGADVKAAGGTAMILVNDDIQGYTVLAEAYDLPASRVNNANGAAIKSYVDRSRNNATASITLKGTSYGNSPAPTVPYFSSRGPSLQTPGILKPDIIAPGVNILAAWPDQPKMFATNYHTNKTMKTFNIISGTSMSTPHLSGTAALVKSVHPDWSPATIKSAIMTMSYVTDNDKNPIVDERLRPADPFSIGSGHVNPLKASDPGLIYDIGPDEYVSLLCGLKYTDKEVKIITHKNVSCEEVDKIEEAQLNYPSIIALENSGNLVVNRTVTNVGKANAKYTAQVVVPKGVDVSVSVSPEVLQFSSVNEKQSFTVSLSWNKRAVTSVAGNLNWVSGEYIVRIPIVVRNTSM